MSVPHTGNLAEKHESDFRFNVYAKHKPTKLYLGYRGLMVDRRAAINFEINFEGIDANEFLNRAMSVSDTDFMAPINVEDIEFETEVA